MANQKPKHSDLVDMKSGNVAVLGGRIFHDSQLLDGYCAVFADSKCVDVLPETRLSDSDFDADQIVDLEGDVLSVGFCDLQVNGGGGVLLNGNPCIETIGIIAAAHRSLGTTWFLPTLITDTPVTTRAAIDACINAIDAGVPGVAGLHLEGPHLSVQKKGAHKAELIRQMQPEDLELLIEASAKLPVLKITIAPENVTLEQVEQLANAGVLVSLGHTDASYASCIAYHRAGARCVTHLFNAMSQLDSREPGLVGAALTSDSLHMGLIADGIHVHPASIRAAINTMGGLHRIYLVTDSMAIAATKLQSFELNGRVIHRSERRLTLDDGTLAGADLELTTAIRVLVEEVGCDLVDVLVAAISTPRRLLGLSKADQNIIGRDNSNLIRIGKSLDSVVLLDQLV